MNNCVDFILLKYVTHEVYFANITLNNKHSYLMSDYAKR